MGSRDQRHDAGIHNTQTLDTVDVEVGVDDTAILLRAHLAGADGVEQGRALLADELGNGIVGGDVRAGDDLEGLELLDGLGARQGAGELHALNQQRQVERVPEETGVGNRSIEGAGGGGLDAAAGVRVLETEDHDSVGPDNLEKGRVGGKKALVQDLLLRLVALDDLGRSTRGQERSAVLRRSLSAESLAGLRVRRKREEGQEVAGRGCEGAILLAVKLGSGLGGEGRVARQEAVLGQGSVNCIVRLAVNRCWNDGISKVGSYWY